MVPGMPFDSARVESLLEARGAKAQPSGGWTWLLENGAVEVHPLREGGQWVATEVRIPLETQTGLIREVVSKGAALAQEAEVRLFDPQLGRELNRHDEGVVADQYERTARYAGEMLGQASAMPSDTSTSEGFQPTTKFVLGAVAFFTLLYLLVNWMNTQLGG
jgi:hypothetical protein